MEMKLMDKKIVFLDIDGTLAEYNRVPLSAKRACHKARQNGHLVYICTGRPRIQISPHILRMGFDGVVSSGGACIEIMERGNVEHSRSPKLLFHASFEGATLRRLLDYLNSGQTPYMLELPGKIYAGPYLMPWFEAIYAKMPRTPRVWVERLFMRYFFRNLIRGEPTDLDSVCKVVFIESKEVTFETIQERFSAECELFRNSIPSAYMKGGEISPRGVHKGAALEKVAAYHAVTRENTVALGDSDNDRTMLEYAGVGIAMGNADEALKQTADDITDKIGKAGLAKAFKKYGLV
jgi:Cof subfamily protein (haloacid dehalogenase superfamily)